MRKIDFVGNIFIVLGFAAIGMMLIVVMWPLGVGIAAIVVAAHRISFFNDKKAVVAEKITHVIATFRPKPQSANDELVDSSKVTTTATSPIFNGGKMKSLKKILFPTDFSS